MDGLFQSVLTVVIKKTKMACHFSKSEFGGRGVEKKIGATKISVFRL